MEQKISIALQMGAAKAEIIPASGVVLSSTFRDICASNGCGLYGRCWMCPPDIGPIDELTAKIPQYRHGLLYQTIGQLEDSFDFEGMTEAGKHHAQVSQRIESAWPAEEHLHLSCGGCRLCEVCAKRTGEPCRHPSQALPPMEGYGIDVYQTVKPTELKYINGQNTVTFFGIVLF